MLIRKVGSALIGAHYYERAVTYYKAAIKSSGHNTTFCLDLAQLLTKLKRDAQARELIEQALKQSQNSCEFHSHISLPPNHSLTLPSLSLPQQTRRTSSCSSPE